MSSEDPMRSYLLLELVYQFPKYACCFGTEMPLRLKLGNEIIIVYLHLNSIMNLKKHIIIKVGLVAVMLFGQLNAALSENCPEIACISEIPCPQQFFKLSAELSFIP